VNFLRWFFSPRSKNDWKSWRSLVITFPAIVGMLFVAPQAVRESRAASRQQSTEGRVIGYERSNYNQCRYTFSVHGRPYGGMRSALTTDVTVGDRVLVYFDSQDPTMNALEDFSAMSQRDKGLCSCSSLSLAVSLALFSTRRQHTQDRETALLARSDASRGVSATISIAKLPERSPGNGVSGNFVTNFPKSGDFTSTTRYTST